MDRPYLFQNHYRSVHLELTMRDLWGLMLLVPMEYSWMTLTPFCLHITNFKSFVKESPDQEDNWIAQYIVARSFIHSVLFLYRILVEDSIIL